MNFNTLCEELGINDNQSIHEKLELLKEWFQNSVSTDLQFSGDADEQYQRYEEATKVYLKHIRPQIGFDIEKPNPELEGESLISAVASMGFDQVLRSLNLTPKMLNTPNKNGQTPLHASVSGGHLNTTRVLLSLGADTSILNNQQQYPMFSALFMPMFDPDPEKLKTNKVEIFKLLRDKGNQHLEHKDSNGETVLHRMALNGFNELITETLKTNPQLACIRNNHALYPIHTAILNNQEKSTRYLLSIQSGADLADSNGWKPLHYAARYANSMILEQCLQYPSHLNEQDHEGRTPLMLAAEQGNLDAVITLINHQAKTDVADYQGLTVLHYAVKSGSPELVRWLLENTQLDVNAKDEHNHTPLSLSETVATESMHMKDISNLLLQHGATIASMTYH